MDKWVVAADHAGVELKSLVVQSLEKQGIDVEDLGGFDAKAMDYFAEDADRLVSKILEGDANYGVLICGSGIGISMRANRYKGIRAALVHNEFSAKSCKLHNNANVICLGERVVPHEDSLRFLEIFMKTEFEEGRHVPRMEKVDAPLVNG